jgi:hypothetical protein
MSDADILRRVEMLEETVNSLRTLPSQVGALAVRMAGVESQILQLRTEMRDEFSGVRTAMAALATKDELERGLGAVREEMADMNAALRAEMAGMKAELREDIAGVASDLTGHFLASEQRTRLLFEDVVARIAMIGDGRPGASR